MISPFQPKSQADQALDDAEFLRKRNLVIKFSDRSNEKPFDKKPVPTIYKPNLFEDNHLKRKNFWIPEEPKRFKPGIFHTYQKRDNLNLEGYRNLGNTCYINAILQSITHLTPFTSDLSDVRLTSSSLKSDTLYRTFLEVIRNKSRQAVVSPKDLKDCIGKASAKFASSRQEDAHEFLCEVLEMLQKELSGLCHDPHSSTNREENTPRNEPQKPLCPIAVNFQMVIKNIVQCKNCDYFLHNISVHRDIAIEIPLEYADSSLDMKYLMRQFFRPEEVEHICEQCGQEDARLFHYIEALPRVLVVHLKRFRVNVEKMIFEKSRIPVLPNQYLKLDEFCSPETQPPSPVKKIIHKELNKTIPEVKTNGFKPSNLLLELVESTKPSPKKDLWFDNSFEPDSDTSILESPVSRKLFLNEEETLREEGEDLQMKWALGESKKVSNPDDDDLQKALELSLKEIQPDIDLPVIPVDNDDGLPIEGLNLPSTYSLRSVVSHLGTGASYGHYVCDVWDPKNNVWKCFNDSVMTETGSFLNLRKKVACDGYLFFYVHEDD